MELNDFFNITLIFLNKYWWIFIIILLILIGLYYYIKQAIYKNRIKYALKAGRVEHFSGRLVGALLLVDIVFYYFKVNYFITLILLIFTFTVWLTYLLSHKTEKKLYPRNFRF